MKTSLKVVNDIKMLIEATVLPHLNGGEIHPIQAPLNASGKYLVVNVLGTSNEYNQFAIANVNIYVPNLKVALPNNAGNDITRPNIPAFNTLVLLIIPLVKTHVGVDFRLMIRDDVGLIQDTDGSWYYSIKLNYWALQNESVA